MPVSGNMYAVNRQSAFERFGSRLQGNRSSLVLVVFTKPVSTEAQEALRKSFAALEFGRDACTYADIAGLDDPDVFSLVEGVDPLCLIAADADAAALCAKAVRQEFPHLQPLRLFGREARAFPDLGSMLEEERDRQLLWHLLKSLR